MQETMVRLQTRGGSIELEGHRPEATLADLVDAVEGARTAPGLPTERCHGCGKCCREPIPVLGYDHARLARRLGVSQERLAERFLSAPQRPDPHERADDIGRLERQIGLSPEEATLIYEHNRSEPVTLERDETGRCCFLENNLCSIYEDRPFICRLYICNMGEKLSILYEQIESQGVWHSYAALGWLDARAIAHNPFLRGARYEQIRLSWFEVSLDHAMEKVFFYF